MVTAAEFTDNAFVSLAKQKLQSAYAFLAELPLDTWRNALILFSAIWICHSLASLFWLVFPTPVPPQPTILAVIPSFVSTGGKTSESIDITALQGMELFGTGSVGSGPIEPEANANSGLGTDIDTNVETTLNLKLQGVIASDRAKLARAIIDDGKEQLLLRIDEELPRNKGVKLARVMDKKIILDNNGKFESLSLYSDDDYSASAAKTQTKNEYRVPTRQAPATNSRETDRNQSSAPEQKATVKREQMPKSISDIVRFSVQREGGQMVGYRIRPGRERDLFDQVGLKANDIVTTVNGIRMDDPTQLKAVYQSLKSATSADLGVLRGGEELSIHISVEGE